MLFSATGIEGLKTSLRMCGGGEKREREMPRGKNKRKRNGEKFPNKYLARDNDTDCLGMSEFRYKRYFPGDDCTEIYLSASTLRLNTLPQSLVISVRKASLFYLLLLIPYHQTWPLDANGNDRQRESIWPRCKKNYFDFIPVWKEFFGFYIYH